MKKIFLALLVFAVSFTATAQTADEIYKKFLDKTGVEKFLDSRNGRSTMAEVAITAGPMVMDCKVTAKYPSFYRIEMDAQGQNVLVIVRDTTAYINAGGKIQVITGQDNINEAMTFVDVVKSMCQTIDLDKYALSLTGQEGKGKKVLNIVECVEKNKKENDQKITLYFNAESNLLEKVIIDITPKEGKPFKIEQTFKDYKAFDDDALFIPTVVATKMPEVTTTTTLKAFEMDFPTANWMFAAPKQQ